MSPSVLFWQNPAGKDVLNWHSILLFRALVIFVFKNEMIIRLVINYLNKGLTDKSHPLLGCLRNSVVWSSLEQFPPLSSCKVCFGLAASK